MVKKLDAIKIYEIAESGNAGWRRSLLSRFSGSLQTRDRVKRLFAISREDWGIRDCEYTFFGKTHILPNYTKRDRQLTSSIELSRNFIFG